jgi:hypothetical protein
MADREAVQEALEQPAEAPGEAPPPTVRQREHFIPLRKSDLIDLLCRQPGMTQGERDAFRRLAQLLSASIHFEHHRRLEELKDAYAPFDPDADTRSVREVTPEQKKEKLSDLMGRFVWLLERANFKRLSREDIRDAMNAVSMWGVNVDVDFNVYDELEVFCRGEGVQIRTLPHTLVRKLARRRVRTIELPIYQRLVLILRLKPGKHVPPGVDTSHVHIKVFKDIPKIDLEMLLPGTRVFMSMKDRVKLGLSFGTGLTMTCYKMVGPVLGLAAGASLSMTALLGVAGGAAGYGVRSFYGYVQTRQKYQLTLTERLYYLNLDNNAGVLFRLMDDAEEQECREALLAYFFLWRNPREVGWSVKELDRHVEAFLKQAASIDVDLEEQDAVAKLRRLRMVEENAEGRLRAAPIEQALEAIDHAWDNHFAYNGRLEPAAEGVRA